MQLLLGSHCAEGRGLFRTVRFCIVVSRLIGKGHYNIILGHDQSQSHCKQTAALSRIVNNSPYVP